MVAKSGPGLRGCYARSRNARCNPLDEGARMRMDGLAAPGLIPTEACNRRDVGRPPGLRRHLVSGHGKLAQQAASATLGAIGQLEVSLTRNKRDIRRLQELRYRVFYEQ